MPGQFAIVIWKNTVLRYYFRIGIFPGQKVRPPTKQWEETTEDEEQLIKDGYENKSAEFVTLFEISEKAKP